MTKGARGGDAAWGNFLKESYRTASGAVEFSLREKFHPKPPQKLSKSGYLLSSLVSFLAILFENRHRAVGTLFDRSNCYTKPSGYEEECFAIKIRSLGAGTARSGYEEWRFAI